jgi:DNA-binding CsgD family transcriptional regulator
MSGRVETLLEGLPERGSIEDLGLLIARIKEVYELEHVVYLAVSLGRNFLMSSDDDDAGVLKNGAGFWRREAGLLATVTYAPEWGDRYVEADYVRIDPVLDGAQRSFLPIDWKTLPWDTKKRRQFLREAIECGIGNQGYTVPVRGPGGQFALFTVNKNCSDDDWQRYLGEYRSDILVIAHYFHQKVLEIERIFGAPPAVQLSAREKDALTMIAAGRSRAQVAHDLQISENTLRVYIDSARHKLGALNIPHAVALAVHKGILNI